MFSGKVATFSLKSFSALLQTGEFLQLFSCLKCGRRSLLKASELSRGSKEGRWSIDITESGGPDLTSTGTVGSVKVVLIVYTGTGLCGLVVSQETSHITESLRSDESKSV